jgi:mono/diheme cytochrome c family protein
MRRWLLAPALAIAAIAVASTPAAAQPDGKALFEKNCMKCHGADGKADTPAGKKMKVPAWDAEDMQAEIVTKTVRGNGKHKTVAKKLSDADLEAIAAYVATLGAP